MITMFYMEDLILIPVSSQSVEKCGHLNPLKNVGICKGTVMEAAIL